MVKMSDFDAIVIGSGINGLTCAATLAKAGWKVVIIEQADMPGGAAKSSELTQKGFISDWYSTNVGSFLNGPFYQEHKNNWRKTALHRSFRTNRLPICSRMGRV